MHAPTRTVISVPGAISVLTNLSANDLLADEPLTMRIDLVRVTTTANGFAGRGSPPLAASRRWGHYAYVSTSSSRPLFRAEMSPGLLLLRPAPPRAHCYARSRPAARVPGRRRRRRWLWHWPRRAELSQRLAGTSQPHTARDPARHTARCVMVRRSRDAYAMPTRRLRDAYATPTRRLCDTYATLVDSLCHAV